MAFGPEQRLAILRDRAADYVNVALTNIVREYPVNPLFIATGPGPYPTHREMHPAFYGCFDWHSCVELHWVTVRLLKLFPDDVPAEKARATLSELLTSENIAAEIRFFSDPNHRTIELPYGWGWLFMLQHELETWDDPDGRQWAATIQPLAQQLTETMLEWLPKLTHPVRTGLHSNTAFGLRPLVQLRHAACQSRRSPPARRDPRTRPPLVPRRHRLPGPLRTVRLR